MEKIGFIGTGKVGSALAILLSQKGYPVVALSSKGQETAQNLARTIKGCRAYPTNQEVVDAAQIIFITTPDDTIPKVAAQIKVRSGQSVIHCSGADSTETLEPARKQCAQTGAMHPLQTFAGVKEAIENMPGSTFAIEALEPLLTTLKKMVAALGGHSIELEASDKVLYHAAAVIACNYMVTLVKLSTDLWKTFGVDTPEAVQALMPLLKGTLNNIDKVGLPNCLTGPIARGDTGTIKKHMDALQKVSPEILKTYKELGRRTVPIALAKGRVSAQQVQDMESLFK